MKKDDSYQVQVFRGSTCGNDETCPMVGALPAFSPGKVQAVGKVITDPDVLAAYRHKIGPGEGILEFDIAMLHQLDLEPGR